MRQFRDALVDFIILVLLAFISAPAPAHAGTINAPLNNNSLSQGLVGYWTVDGEDMAGIEF